MKEKLLTLILLLILPMVMSRAETEIDGIYYNLNSGLKTAEVAQNPNKYSNAVNIPESVIYESVAYSVTSIGYQAFRNCSGLTSVTIPNSVISIGYQAFFNCSSLASVTIPNGVTKIDGGVFYKCIGLKNVTIPSSVTSIGWCSFGFCSSLVSVTIPESVTSIGESAFTDCSSLRSVTSYIQNPFETEFFAFSGIPSDATLYVPKGTVAQYHALSDWNRFTNITEIQDTGAYTKAELQAMLNEIGQKLVYINNLKEQAEAEYAKLDIEALPENIRTYVNQAKEALQPYLAQYQALLQQYAVLQQQVNAMTGTDDGTLYKQIIAFQETVNSGYSTIQGNIALLTDQIKAMAADDLEQKLEAMSASIYNDIPNDLKAMYTCLYSIREQIGDYYFMKKGDDGFMTWLDSTEERLLKEKIYIDTISNRFKTLANNHSIATIEDVVTFYTEYVNLQESINDINDAISVLNDDINALINDFYNFEINFPDKNLAFAIRPTGISNELQIGYKQSLGFVLTPTGMMWFEQKEGADFYLKDANGNYIVATSDGTTQAGNKAEATVWTGKCDGNGNYTFNVKGSNRYLGCSGTNENSTLTVSNSNYNYSWTITESELGSVYINGIYYKLSENYAEVISGKQEYSGVVVIPATVTYKGTTYPVTSIGERAFYGSSNLTSVLILSGDALVYTNNLIKNGDFSLGNVGFSSDYEYVSETGSYVLRDEGKYAVGTSPKNYFNTDFVNHGDHTTGTGNMLIANGSPNNLDYVWKQNVFVEKGKIYEFSAWFLKANITDYDTSKEDIEFSINGTPIIGSYDKTENDWKRFYGRYTATESDEIEIKIRTVSEVRLGNDFAIDDISFSTLSAYNSGTSTAMSIGVEAFYGCSSLTSITIGSGVTSIGTHAFSNCSNLTSVTSNILNPFVTGSEAFAGIPSNATLYVPKGTESKYRPLADWNRFTNIVAIRNEEPRDYDWSIGIGGDFVDVNAAMQDDRVKDGDVLQVLPSSVISGEQTITKAVTLRGNGYKMDSNGILDSDVAQLACHLNIEVSNAKVLNLAMPDFENIQCVRIRDTDVTIEGCYFGELYSQINYDTEAAIIRKNFIRDGIVGNQAYGWIVQNNIILGYPTAFYDGTCTITNLEAATIDHNIIYSRLVSTYTKSYCIKDDVIGSQITNNIIVHFYSDKNYAGTAIGTITATGISNNTVSHNVFTGTAPNGNNRGGINAVGDIFVGGYMFTDSYFQLVSNSLAAGYATDGSDCGPWGGSDSYVIGGIKENIDPTHWTLDPTLTTDPECYEFATLDALINYLFNIWSWWKDGMTNVTVSVADATYTMDIMDMILSHSAYTYNDVDEMLIYLMAYADQIRDEVDALKTISININMEAPHEAVFQFYVRYSQALNYIQALMNTKETEMLAQGISQGVVDAQRATWETTLADIMAECQETMQILVSYITITNISVLIDGAPYPIPPSEIEPNDLLALKNIYNMLGGSSWTNKKWKINGKVNDYDYKKEDFPGVTFDDEGYVVQINLENNNLRGSINASGWTWELGLPRLTGLYLQKNNISGDLSLWLRDRDRCNRLKALDMSYNNLTEISDSIPSSITSLNLDSQNREWYRPSGVYIDPLKIEAMSTMTPIRLYLSSKQTVVVPSLFTYDRVSQTHSATPTIYIINAEGADKYGYFTPSAQGSYSLVWNNEEYTEKQNAPCYVRFENPFSGSVYPAYLRYIEGDANMSGYTDVLDVQITLNYVLTGGGVWQFNRSAANTYADNQINVQDIVCMVNIVLDNEAVAEGVILNQSSPRRHLRRAADAIDAQGWLYTQQGRVMLTTASEMGAIDIELKGVSTSQVSLLLNHSQYQMIGRNTEEGSRYVIFSPTGQPIPASEEVALMAVSAQTELIAAQAADMDAQEMELAIGQPTGLEAIDNGQLTIDNAPIYNVAGQRLSKMQRGINIINSRKVLK